MATDNGKQFANVTFETAKVNDVVGLNYYPYKSFVVVGKSDRIVLIALGSVGARRSFSPLEFNQAGYVTYHGLE